MSKVSDEILMAYADGQLPAEERVQIERILASDAGTRAALKAFEFTRSALSGLFDRPMYEPLPDRLVEPLLRGAEPRSQKLRRTRKARKSNGLSALWDAVMPSPLVPMAATLAIGIIVGTGMGMVLVSPKTMLVGQAVQNSGDVKATGALAQVLETAAMGQTVSWDTGSQLAASVKVAFTFKNHAREYCRQYALNQNRTRQFSGIACRTGSGVWSVRVHQPQVRVTGSDKPRNYTPAVGKHTLVDSVIGKMISGDVLTKEQEAALVSAKWPKD